MCGFRPRADSRGRRRLELDAARPMSNRGRMQVAQDRSHGLAYQLDEQLRRYEDLARRAGDLRSYL